MMNLLFIIDKKYDLIMAKAFGFSKKEIDIIENRYKSSLRFLKLTTKLYQQSWDEINDDFSKYVEKTTGYS